MKCNECGFENQEGSVFCSKCGTRLAMECPNCRKTVPFGSRFCNYCGQALIPTHSGEKWQERTIDASSTNNAESFSEKLNHSNTRLIISVFCGIIAIVLLVVGFSTQGRQYWDQEDVIGYFIGFLLFGIGALFAYKTELVTKAKNAGIILAIIGVLVFLFGVVCDGFDFDWYYIRTNFFVGLIILLGGLFLCFLNRDKEQHSAGNIFSFRRVGSVMVVGLSLLYIILIVSGIDDIDDLDAATVLALILYLFLLIIGIRGFNAKDAKKGKTVIVMATIILIISLIGIYGYNEMIKNSRYYSSLKMKYSSPLLMYVIMLVPAIFMCITPKYLQDEGKGM